MSKVSQGDICPFELKTENIINPLGIDNLYPRFRWKLSTEKRSQVQTAYRILVASGEAWLDRDTGDIWDSGKVFSDETVNIKYEGSSLESSHRYYWKVMVWDGKDAASEWSSCGWFEMGLLKAEDWQGEWNGGNSSYIPLEGAQ